VLDFGAGRNIGGRILGADTLEPNPMRDFAPTFLDSSDIKSNHYNAVISNAVLNVVPDDIRDFVVSEMGRVLKPGGKMFVNVRGDDVFNSNHRVLNKDKMEVIVERDGTYQKGFKQQELESYLEGVLGEGYKVEKPSKGKEFGKVSVVVTKKTHANPKVK